MLGLLALAWCLVFAPVLHRLTHAHGHQHTHRADGTFEHQSVVFTQAPTPPLVAPVLLALVAGEAVAPEVPELISPRRVEQAQAP